MLRVIAGEARRLQLKSLDGKNTRPTLDRIKETLFNIIQPDISNSIFVDLFSGTGQMAIEALSRGAAYAYLVEMNKNAVSVINYNLEHTKYTDKSEVLAVDVNTAIRRLSDKGVVADYIYIDPPYLEQHDERVLSELSRSSLLGDDTLVIVEAKLDTDFSFTEGMGYSIERIKEYKTNKHIFLKRTN
ncbi:MAG: 16S rRNA (guanine(966)-N(2))-methyltransferase RsmD [Lachnospiraceae bacterium]|nr:16S rRNA (guanine(966)-N(2))-methyltransferase RsmD [Lachnospiraceae bacterium]